MMLILGHVGVTLGIFFLIGLLIPKIGSRLDYRYLAVGSLLPDIIDKPLGWLLLADSLGNGRVIAHTLVFSFGLGLVGYYMFKKRDNPRVLMLASGSFFHLLEDQMWIRPVTFFWPIFGLQFPKGMAGEYGFAHLLEVLSRSFDPEFSYAFISDMVGLIVVILLIVVHLRKR